ncbi:hypothetical protein Tco_0039143 [Tanacetum coccineum]
MAFHNFMKKPDQSPSFFVRSTDQLVDLGSPSVEPLRSITDNDQAETSLLKDKGVSGFKFAVVREGIPGQSANVVGEGSKRRRSITESLEEEATVVKIVSKKKKLEALRRMSARGSVPPSSTTFSLGIFKYSFLDVEESHAAHNMISGLHCPLLKDKLGFSSFDELVDVFDVHALQKAVKNLLEREMSKLEDHLAKAQRNQDVEGSQVVKDLRSENARILEEVLMLRSVAASVEEPQRELSEDLSGLRPRLVEADHLKQRCQDLERERDFLLTKSEEVSVLSSKLEATSHEKAKFAKDFLPFVALDEVHGLGDSWDFKDVQDYHPKAEKLFDEAAEAFYTLAFPYISILSRKAGQSLVELSTVEAPSIQETPSA